jgi:hypothetical protein
MTKRTAQSIILTLAVITLATLSARSAREDQPSNWLTIENQYAQANLALAKARLALAESQNRTVQNTISDETMNMLKTGVQLAQDQAKQLAVNKKADSLSPQIAAAEALLLGLQENEAKSLQANKIQPGVVPDVELKRQHGEIEVAKARLAALKLLASQPPEVRIEWQIRMLQDDIRSLWARPLIED